ncbi:hypothetical protein D3C78_1337280 [compost metagenome]
MQREVHLRRNGQVAVAGGRQTQHFQLAIAQQGIRFAAAGALLRHTRTAEEIGEEGRGDAKAAAPRLEGYRPVRQQLRQAWPLVEEGAQEAFAARQLQRRGKYGERLVLLTVAGQRHGV